MIDGAVQWATDHGPPNWVFVVALLTHPTYWAKQFKARVQPVFDRYLPGE